MAVLVAVHQVGRQQLLLVSQEVLHAAIEDQVVRTNAVSLDTQIVNAFGNFDLALCLLGHSCFIDGQGHQ